MIRHPQCFLSAARRASRTEIKSYFTEVETEAEGEDHRGGRSEPRPPEPSLAGVAAYPPHGLPAAPAERPGPPVPPAPASGPSAPCPEPPSPLPLPSAAGGLPVLLHRRGGGREQTWVATSLWTSRLQPGEPHRRNPRGERAPPGTWAGFP